MGDDYQAVLTQRTQVVQIEAGLRLITVVCLLYVIALGPSE